MTLKEMRWFSCLSWKNLDRLRQGNPIRFDGRPYGIPMDVWIIAGETEQKLADELIHPDTTIIKEREEKW